MSQRSKNLLEAFNQSKAPEKSVQPVTPPRGSAPRVGGPFADPAAAPRPKESPRPQESRARDARAQAAWFASASRGRLILLGSVIAATFFLLGRFSAPGVQAAADGGARAPGEPENGAPGSPTAAPTATIEQRLFDKSNKYSILAVTYTSTPANTDLANIAWARLLELGLPAAKPYKNAEKNQLTIFVGAAPKLADLDDLRSRVKSATTATGRQDFTPARGVPIDNYIDRGK